MGRDLSLHIASVNKRVSFLAGMIRSRIGSSYWKAITDRLMLHRNRPNYMPIDDLVVIYQFVQDALTYRKEKDGTDIFMTGEEAIRRGYGDCDEQTQIVGILAATAGHPVKVRAVGFKGKGGYYTHIYPLVFVDGRWVAMDVTSRQGVGFQATYERSIEVEV